MYTVTFKVPKSTIKSAAIQLQKLLLSVKNGDFNAF